MRSLVRTRLFCFLSSFTTINSVIYSSCVVLPVITPFSFGTTTLNAGSFATLQCIVSVGDLPLNIEWSYPGMNEPVVGTTVQQIGDRIKILTIPELSYRHVGNYTCRAKNAAGQAEVTTPLLISGT